MSLCSSAFIFSLGEGCFLQTRQSPGCEHGDACSGLAGGLATSRRRSPPSVSSLHPDSRRLSLPACLSQVQTNHAWAERQEIIMTENREGPRLPPHSPGSHLLSAPHARGQSLLATGRWLLREPFEDPKQMVLEEANGSGQEWLQREGSGCSRHKRRQGPVSVTPWKCSACFGCFAVAAGVLF